MVKSSGFLRHFLVVGEEEETKMFIFQHICEVAVLSQVPVVTGDSTENQTGRLPDLGN